MTSQSKICAKLWMLTTHAHNMTVSSAVQTHTLDVRDELSVQNRIRTDVIDEQTAGSGVIIDGVLLKDGVVVGGSSPDPLLVNVITERTGGSGVTIEGVLHEDGEVIVTDVSNATSGATGSIRTTGGIGVVQDVYSEGSVTAETALVTDLISERTGAAGVTIDGVIIKDSDLIYPQPRADFHVSASAATTITDMVTFFPVAGTTTNSVSHAEFTHANNSFTYTGTRTRMATGTVSICTTETNNNQVLHMGLLKNGTIVDATIIARKFGTGTDVGSSMFTFMITMKTNDVIRVGVKNTTSASNVTAIFMQLDVFMLADEELVEIP